MTFALVEEYSVTEAPTRQVRKRDGVNIQEFEIDKIHKALSSAWIASTGIVNEKIINKVLTTVLQIIPNQIVEVELIQDAVETALMHHGQFAVAKAYILYRHERQNLRQLRPKVLDTKGISDYIHASKYARYLPELKRREVYEETVARVEKMHCTKFPALSTEINTAFDLVREKRLLPSMRSMQFGGAAIEANNNRMFNCSFTLVDRLDVFAEAMYLLLSGCGVGYSVQFEHVEKLPLIGTIDQKKIIHFVIEDTIEGWADALKALVNSFQTKTNIEFSYHKIRDAGVPLKTSGGRAPGHVKLKESLEQIRRVLLGAQGRKLRPIECHRILCHAADAVLSGGIRRSAMICLFSLDDSELLYSKTGNWFSTDPWFANANNSVVLKRDEVSKKQFKRIFQMVKEWGEPGFYFTNNYMYGTNPCAEIGLDPNLKIDETLQQKLKLQNIDVIVGNIHTGWAFCNLCEINAAKLTTFEDFKTAAKAATLIGTLQASYTKMPYLGWVSEELATRDALLGIGMTGILDAPEIACNPHFQKEVALAIKKWNAEYANKIGVRAAARTTCVKPSGTTSLELGCVGSGHHAHHARRYIRRVTADELEPVFQAFKKINPHMCIQKPDGKWVIEFPVEAPEGAIVKDDISAISFLEMVKSTQQNWVIPGTSENSPSPGLEHNVSNTVTVGPNDWDTVADYLWTNKEYFTGVALIAHTGDKDYAFAPNEAILTAADEHRWNNLIKLYQSVDYTALIEENDVTNLNHEVACAGGLCLIV